MFHKSRPNEYRRSIDFHHVAYFWRALENKQYLRIQCFSFLFDISSKHAISHHVSEWRAKLPQVFRSKRSDFLKKTTVEFPCPYFDTFRSWSGFKSAFIFDSFGRLIQFLNICYWDTAQKPRLLFAISSKILEERFCITDPPKWFSSIKWLIRARCGFYKTFLRPRKTVEQNERAL